MITTVYVETSWQKNENGGYDPSPFHPDNILVSIGINDEYYFTNHSERIVSYTLPLYLNPDSSNHIKSNFIL